MPSNYYPCLFALTVLPPKLSKIVTSTMVNSDFSCHMCGRQFVKQPQKKVIDGATRELIDRLLLERISLLELLVLSKFPNLKLSFNKM